MLQVNLTTSDLGQLAKALKRRKSHIETAMRRAAVSFNALLRSDVLTEVRRRVGLNRADMNKIRIRSKVARKKLQVELWVGSNPVDIRYLGFRFTRNGVVVGRGESRQTFPAAFMPWKSSGNSVILQRIGKARLPVTRPDIDINPIVIEVIERKWAGLEAYFWKRVERELLEIK